tara:strand:+ start:1063 stop:1539 length:477 start_codon:yes stop_codon:yes gene_type:complete
MSLAATISKYKWPIISISILVCTLLVIYLFLPSGERETIFDDPDLETNPNPIEQSTLTDSNKQSDGAAAEAAAQEPYNEYLSRIERGDINAYGAICRQRGNQIVTMCPSTDIEGYSVVPDRIFDDYDSNIKNAKDCWYNADCKGLESYTMFEPSWGLA